MAVVTRSCLVTACAALDSNCPVLRYTSPSVHAHLGLRGDTLVTMHPAYLALYSARELRASYYRVWLKEGVGEDKLAALRPHSQQERALGSPRFQQMVEAALGRSVTVRQPGRPECVVTCADQTSDSNANVL